MADLIQFVDSLDAAPAVRLDLNDESAFWVKSFSAPPPRLRRSMASNSMRDGISVGSSAYDGRTLTMEIECRKSTQDAAAVEMQKLWRELDRATNLIRYHPQGASKPVFFRTFRSDASQLADVVAQAAMRTFTVEVLAEPFALGLEETLGPYTVYNNSATAGSTTLSLTLSGVLGDVDAPVTIVDSTAVRSRGVVAVSNVTPLEVRPAETGFTLGPDTANPGGGPDAAMAGTGTNNFVRTTFATNAAMTTRLGMTITSAVGFRVFAAVRRSNVTSDISARLVIDGVEQAAVTLPLAVNRQLVDLGRTYAFDPTHATSSVFDLQVRASRTGGSDTLDWDEFYFVPTDGVMAAWNTGYADDTTNDMYVLSAGEASMTRRSSPTTTRGLVPFSGDTPRLRVGVTNYLTWIVSGQAVFDKTAISSLTITYHPHYLFARPVSS